MTNKKIIAIIISILALISIITGLIVIDYLNYQNIYICTTSGEDELVYEEELVLTYDKENKELQLISSRSIYSGFQTELDAKTTSQFLEEICAQYKNIDGVECTAKTIQENKVETYNSYDFRKVTPEKIGGILINVSPYYSYEKAKEYLQGDNYTCNKK